MCMKNRTEIIKYGILNGITFLFSSFGILLFIAIFCFTFTKGWKNLSFEMIVNDYYEKPYFLCSKIKEDSYFTLENENDIYYSKHFGIGLKDAQDLEGNPIVKIVFIHNLSPIKNATNLEGNKINIKEGVIIKRLQIIDTEGKMNVQTASIGAKKMCEVLDTSYEIKELYYCIAGGGIRGSLITTFYLILLTIVIVAPIGILSATYLAIYAKKNRVTNLLRILIDMISGIPSIIFGLVAVVVFIPFVNGITKNTGGSIVSGAITLAIMLLPTVIKTTEEAIYAIPKSYWSASLALGASETQTTFKIMIPNAISGILTSVILSIGSIIGESAALIFAIGTVIQDEISIFSASATLAVHIWSVLSQDSPNYGQACAISIIILLIILVINLLVKLLGKRLNKYARSSI